MQNQISIPTIIYPWKLKKKIKDKQKEKKELLAVEHKKHMFRLSTHIQSKTNQESHKWTKINNRVKPKKRDI